MNQTSSITDLTSEELEMTSGACFECIGAFIAGVIAVKVAIVKSIFGAILGGGGHGGCGC